MDSLLGLHTAASDLTFAQMAARTVVAFCVGVVLFRLADRRFIGQSAGFDVLLGVVLGSVLSRAINGQASFFPTLGASALLILLHHALNRLACRFHWVSLLIKGRALPLIRDRELVPGALDRARMTTDDLEENLRLNGGVDSVVQVREARLERNGSISVLTNSDR